MIPFAIPAALAGARKFAASWWKAGVGAVIGAALILPVGQCQGANAERTRQAVKAAEARELAATQNAARVQRQAAEREAANVAITQAAKGRSDAIHAGPDAVTAAPDCRALRQRMLRDGWRDADLPPCR